MTATTDPIDDGLAPLRELLQAGFPAHHIKQQALRRERDLLALLDGTYGRSEVLEAVRKFIRSLP